VIFILKTCWSTT